MAKNEDGEFELVLGNRQLLSVFFIVVILVGVFFTMGYIVGRNSAPGIVEAKKGEPKPIVVDGNARPSPSGSAVDQTPPAEQKTDATQAGSATGMDANSAPQASAPPSKPAETEKRPEAAAASAVPEEPAAGQTYLQVIAVPRDEAELVTDVLAKKGFRAIFAAVPEKQGMFRVLVGPYRDTSAMGQARTDLEKAGFKNTIVRKY